MTKPSVFKSRKFWIMIFDVLVSLTVTVGGWYLAPAILDKVVAIIAILQAPVLFVIGAIAYEDGKVIENQNL
jgi:hypothetical protein